jgi:putative sterol carrier protein
MITRSEPRQKAVDAFFADIATRGKIAVLGTTSGTIRFDISNADSLEHWYVTVRKGEVAVSHKNTRADTVCELDKGLFEDIAEGRRQAMSALLRGALVAQGDMSLLMSFQRLFPGRIGSKGRVAPITEVAQDR